MGDPRQGLRSLPPVPDVTGEPRPPRAPRVADPQPAISRHLTHAEGVPLPTGDEPTAGERTFARAHPALEIVAAGPAWGDRHLGRDGRYQSAAVAGIGVLIIVVNAQVGAVAATATAMVAVVLAVCGLGARNLSPLPPPAAYAAAHALANAFGHTVALYELTSVTITGRAGRPRLVLTGPDAQRVEFPLRLLESNPHLWDLVHHGIRHSHARGAVIDGAIARRLRLAEPPGPVPSPPPAVPTVPGLPPEVNGRGEPRPPRAPEITRGWRGWRAPKEYLADPGDDDLRPSLVTMEARRRYGRFRAATRFAGLGCLPTAMLIALVCAAALLVSPTGPGLSVATNFLGWTLVVGYLLTFGLYWFDRRSLMLSVGARSLSDDIGDRVDLYALATVRVKQTLRGGLVLLLTDRVGGRIGVPLGLLEASPTAWDLVHLGLCHSSARGAWIDDRTRAILRIGRGRPA